MTKTVLRLIGLAALLAAAAIAGADTAPAPERIVVPLSNPGKPALIHADLMFGSIKITGYEGKDVIVEARPTAKPIGGKNTEGVKFWAPSVVVTHSSTPASAAMAPAPPAPAPRPGLPFFVQDNDKEKEKQRKEKAAGMKQVPLDNSGLTVEEDNNHVSIEVESFRSGYDLDIKAPFASNLKIEGANLGGITVEGITGEIEIESANGGVKLGNISGSVVATTTNGDLEAVLNRIAADKPMSFVTFHGDIDVTLPADAKVNVRIKSNMGEVYSDFDIALKQAPPDSENSPKREGGKFRVSLDRSIYGTINGGGPELKFENFSGNVYLRKKK
ncbi:MAG: DUF4097 family beta strand repeat-containing protein [Candidatus Aminicenantales bacterium]|jgi:hypothetical protein